MQEVIEEVVTEQSEQVQEASAPEPVPEVSSLPGLDINEDLDWESLQKQVENCQSCGLHEHRIYPVFGDGDKQARVLFIGEAPGAEEDRQGEPFVGEAGQLLTEMLFAIGFKRSQVFVTNILKCRPPSNRDPHVDELQSCKAHLQKQIQLLAPDVIVALGRIAAHSLLNTDASLANLREQQHCYGDNKIPVIVTYHPAYLLRKPVEKSKSWNDLQKLMLSLQQRSQS